MRALKSESPDVASQRMMHQTDILQVGPAQLCAAMESVLVS